MSFRTFQNGDIGLSIDCWDAETRRRLELIPGLRVDEMEGAARGKVDAVAVAASRLGKKAPSHEFKSGGLVHSLPSMRHYQREGVAKLMSILRAHRGAVLADDMGLGKTLQTIATARSLRADAGRDRVLIVCPAYVRETWVEELAKWAPGETVAVIRPGKAKKQEAEWDKALTAQWVISSYEMAGTVFDAAFARGGPFMLMPTKPTCYAGERLSAATGSRPLQSRQLSGSRFLARQCGIARVTSTSYFALYSAIVLDPRSNSTWPIVAAYSIQWAISKTKEALKPMS